MNKLSLLVAAALLACGTLAQAEPSTPNPFARPQAASPAAGAPGATPPGTQTMPQGATSPVSQPGQPGMLPSSPPGFTPGPGVPPPPVSNGLPMPSGVLPGPTVARGVETTEEEVMAQRIGTVNGERLYRGQNTYMFESPKSRKIIRKLVPSTTPIMPALSPTPGLPPATTAQPANKAPNLPSMVGRPTPK